MFRNGRNKNGFVSGSEGGGEAIVDPDEEWNDVDSGDLGELTDDSGESQTLMIGDDVSLRSGSSIFILGTKLFWLFDSNMAQCLQSNGVTWLVAFKSWRSVLCVTISLMFSTQECSFDWKMSQTLV